MADACGLFGWSRLFGDVVEQDGLDIAADAAGNVDRAMDIITRAENPAGERVEVALEPSRNIPGLAGLLPALKPVSK
jgi:hypothetical protein